MSRQNGHGTTRRTVIVAGVASLALAFDVRRCQCRARLGREKE